jgi:hypothetical protein
MISISINAVTSGGLLVAGTPPPLDDFMWTAYPLTFASFSTAAATNTILLASPPAKTVLHGVAIKHDVAFTGGGLTGYTLSVGRAAVLDRHATAHSVFSVPNSTNAELSLNFACDDFVIPTQFNITAVCTGGLLNAATAGTVTIWLCTTLIP